jgi:protein-L-isoaspartate(D-aspartate) O-methyltransferase
MSVSRRREGPAFPLPLARVRPAPAVRRAPPGDASTVQRPQGPLQHAADEAQRRVAATGLGLDSQGVRDRMVQRLRAAGIRSEAVLLAMASVPRHAFVARMLEILMDAPAARARGQLNRVLEIGTGCGYQAALLAHLARTVISVERLRTLHDKAREQLAPLRATRTAGDIRLVYGDGQRGHPPNAPYEGIIAAAGGEHLPAPWLEQLAVGGRLVAPLQRSGHSVQTLVVVERTETSYRRSFHEAVHFVPLKSGLG